MPNIPELATVIGLPTTVLVLVSITDTAVAPVESRPLTYTRVPSELTARPLGNAIVIGLPTRVLVEVSNTDTAPTRPTPPVMGAIAEFVTYKRVPSGLMATPAGDEPMPMTPGVSVPTTVLVAVLITDTRAAPVAGSEF